MNRLVLELTDAEITILSRVIKNELRTLQGNGTLSDEEDDALVTLNDAMEHAIRELKR